MQKCHTMGGGMRRKEKAVQGLKRQDVELPGGTGPGAGGGWLCSCKSAGTLSQLPGAIWKGGPWLQTQQPESSSPPGPLQAADLLR